MKIRSKIVLIVLPLLASGLIITGTISGLSARTGLTRIAMRFLGFKSQELKKYIDNQWNLLVSNNLDSNPDYVDVTKTAIASYADTLVRGETELIFAIDENGDVVMFTSELVVGQNESSALNSMFMRKKEGISKFLFQLYFL